MAQEERRKYERLKKPFVVSYHVFADPASSYDLTQIKDVSIGGMRFVTSQAFPSDTILSLELRAPFKEERLKLKGCVIESKVVAEGLIYDTRVNFVDLGSDAREELSKIINVFLKTMWGRKSNED